MILTYVHPFLHIHPVIKQKITGKLKTGEDIILHIGVLADEDGKTIFHLPVTFISYPGMPINVHSEILDIYFLIIFFYL